MSLSPLSPAQLAAREAALTAWLSQQSGHAVAVTPVSGDASFRRYFRFWHNGQPHVAMDAPPSHEDCHPFAALADAYDAAGVQVPHIQARDLANGFLWLRDFGDQLLLPLLGAGRVDGLYHQAMAILPIVFTVTHTSDGVLPPYDEAMLRREMALFSDWLLPRHLGYDMDGDAQALWQGMCDVLVANALSQPQGGVHRDYHSRNLMLLADGSIGVIDFQDAVVGPITYDLVSLLRDCYIAWPDAQVYGWVEWYRQHLMATGRTDVGDAETFRRWFDLMGMQRHLKASGIFARLLHRDGKPGYIADIPRTVNYILTVGARYPELAAAIDWLKRDIWPRIEHHCAERRA